jgi:hypothetical protein
MPNYVCPKCGSKDHYMGTMLVSGGGAIMESPMEGIYTSHKAPDKEKAVRKCKKCDTLLGDKDKRLTANERKIARQQKQTEQANIEGCNSMIAPVACLGSGGGIIFLIYFNLYPEEFGLTEEQSMSMGFWGWFLLLFLVMLCILYGSIWNDVAENKVKRSAKKKTSSKSTPDTASITLSGQTPESLGKKKSASTKASTHKTTKSQKTPARRASSKSTPAKTAQSSTTEEKPQTTAKLGNCPDCEREISKRAASCPHCGCPNPFGS